MEGVDLIEPHQAESNELEPLNDIPSIYIVPRKNSPGGSAAESLILGLHPSSPKRLKLWENWGRMQIAFGQFAFGKQAIHSAEDWRSDRLASC